MPWSSLAGGHAIHQPSLRSRNAAADPGFQEVTACESGAEPAGRRLAPRHTARILVRELVVLRRIAAMLQCPRPMCFTEYHENWQRD